MCRLCGARAAPDGLAIFATMFRAGLAIIIKMIIIMRGSEARQIRSCLEIYELLFSYESAGISGGVCEKAGFLDYIWLWNVAKSYMPSIFGGESYSVDGCLCTLLCYSRLFGMP